jgi:hypothetical protein
MDLPHNPLTVNPLVNRIQPNTDGHRVHADAVESAFSCDIDYAILVKIYGSDREKRPSALHMRIWTIEEVVGFFEKASKMQHRSGS